MKNNFRCVQCNRVSSVEIETNVEEIVKGDFYWDKKRHFSVCSECQAVHERLMFEYGDER